jgi:hypothetical protein
MKKNIGTIDKILRVIIAIVIAVLYYMDIIIGDTLSAVILFLAALLLITSLLNFCPLYFILRINSCRKDTEIKDE